MARKFLGAVSLHVFVHDDGRLECEPLLLVPPANAEAIAQVLADIAQQIRKTSAKIQVVPAGAINGKALQ